MEVILKEQAKKEKPSLKTTVYYKSVLYYKENLNITNNTENGTGIYSLGQSSLLNRHFLLFHE